MCQPDVKIDEDICYISRVRLFLKLLEAQPLYQTLKTELKRGKGLFLHGPPEVNFTPILSEVGVLLQSIENIEKEATNLDIWIATNKQYQIVVDNLLSGLQSRFETKIKYRMQVSRQMTKKLDDCSHRILLILMIYENWKMVETLAQDF